MWSISWQDLEFLPNTCLIEIWKRRRLSHSSCINPHIGHAIQISLWTVRKIQTMLEGTIKICLVFVLNHKTKYIKADPSPAVRTRNEIDMALSQQRFGLSYVVTNFPESFVQVPTSKFHLPNFVIAITVSLFVAFFIHISRISSSALTTLTLFVTNFPNIQIPSS